MGNRTIIKIIGITEVLIGLSSFFAAIIFSFMFISKRPLNVFFFVIIASVISYSIGLGLLDYKNWARLLLVFFSGYIIVTKILMFLNLLYFKGEIITFIPIELKNTISIIYHAFVKIYLTRPFVKKYFH